MQRSDPMTVFGRTNPQAADEQALARYRYMIKTAPPETIEQAHAEAFAQLTPEQRRLVLQAMRDDVPRAERAMAEQGGATPEALARMATRAEIRRPGSTERMFGQAGGASLGGMMAGSLLSSIAGAVIGSMIARQFFADPSPSASEGAAEPAQDTDAGEIDQAMGDSPDLGSFDV
jgi:transposase